MNIFKYLEIVSLFVLHTITIDELATVTSPIPRIPSSSHFFVASKEKRRRKMFTWTLGRNMCKRNSPVFMKTETSLISCQAQVGPTPHSGLLKKKQFVTASHKVVVELCTGRKSCKKGTTCTWCLAIALGAWQLQLYLHFVPVTKEGRENVLTRGDVFSKSTAGPTIVIIIIPG